MWFSKNKIKPWDQDEDQEEKMKKGKGKTFAPFQNDSVSFIHSFREKNRKRRKREREREDSKWVAMDRYLCRKRSLIISYKIIIITNITIRIMIISLGPFLLFRQSFFLFTSFHSSSWFPEFPFPLPFFFYRLSISLIFHEIDLYSIRH